ncbi:MAG: SDR family oxidoreductase [Candidatus Atribacteria bacterium]|nr:SDR family oxidoreductase [Candidatus Atribacteria bacterium]
MPKLEPGQWAFVTGASSGIGECFAYELAKKGVNLILLGRDPQALERVTMGVEQESKVRFETLHCDLTRELDRAVSILQEFDVDLLVNNAGIGVYGEFLAADFSRYREMIGLNIVALTELSFHAGKRMIEKGQGGIINIGSLAGFFPLSNFAVYAATKAYVYSLSLALWAEWRKHNVHVLYVAPGSTETKFFERSRNGARRPKGSPGVMKPEDVVREAILAYERNRIICIPGWRNRLLPFFGRRFFPDWMVAWFAKRYH